MSCETVLMLKACETVLISYILWDSVLMGYVLWDSKDSVLMGYVL